MLDKKSELPNFPFYPFTPATECLDPQHAPSTGGPTEGAVVAGAGVDGSAADYSNVVFKLDLRCNGWKTVCAA